MTELTFEVLGEAHTLELHPPTRQRIRKLAMILMDSGESDWDITMYVQAIDGEDPLLASGVVQWAAHTEAQDFLSHSQNSIGADDSKYARKGRTKERASASSPVSGFSMEV